MSDFRVGDLVKVLEYVDPDEVNYYNVIFKNGNWQNGSPRSHSNITPGEAYMILDTNVHCRDEDGEIADDAPEKIYFVVLSSSGPAWMETKYIEPISEV